jgi:hypothetical protein
MEAGGLGYQIPVAICNDFSWNGNLEILDGDC